MAKLKLKFRFCNSILTALCNNTIMFPSEARKKLGRKEEERGHQEERLGSKSLCWTGMSVTHRRKERTSEHPLLCVSTALSR